MIYRAALPPALTMALLFSCCQPAAHADCTQSIPVAVGCLLAIGDRIVTEGSVVLSVNDDGLFADGELVLRHGANTVFVDRRLMAERDEIPLYHKLRASGSDEVSSIEECARARASADRRVAAALASMADRSEFAAVRDELMKDAAIADVVQAIAWPDGEAYPRWKLFGDTWGEVELGAHVAGPTLAEEVASWCGTLAEISNFLHGASQPHLGVVVGGSVAFFGKDDFASLIAEAQDLTASGRLRAAAAAGYRISRESW